MLAYYCAAGVLVVGFVTAALVVYFFAADDAWTLAVLAIAIAIVCVRVGDLMSSQRDD